MKILSFKLVFHLFLILNSCLHLQANEVQVEKEKLVIFYPSYGYQVSSTSSDWIIPFRIWVNEDLDAVRKLSLKTARKIIEQKVGIDDLSDSQKKIFLSRAQDFLRDSESGEQIKIQFESDPRKINYVLSGANGEHQTDRNGNLSGEFKISQSRADELLKAQQSNYGWLSFTINGAKHYGTGTIRLISSQGLSVISDIDDTIKVTDIPLGNRVVLNNTFFREFDEAPGMSEMYQSYEHATAFHYVSGGPWQLYRPLSNFLIEPNGNFPKGSFHMKNVRTNLTESETYDDFSNLIGGGATQTQKLEQISNILKHFPKRKFILIGDSGEHDPEVFSEIRKNYPKQIIKIIIRDANNEIKNNPKRLIDMEVVK